ncbi:MAG: hypothetical protein K9G70_00245 [Prolixibacteraceae bacterium]|nr:hypothetical protein [Prolixibacteraceae bacterium]
MKSNSFSQKHSTRKPSADTVGKNGLSMTPPSGLFAPSQLKSDTLQKQGEEEEETKQGKDIQLQPEEEEEAAQGKDIQMQEDEKKEVE